MPLNYEIIRLQVRDAGHCFATTETQTFTKMLTLGLINIYLKHSVLKGLMFALEVWVVLAMVKH